MNLSVSVTLICSMLCSRHFTTVSWVWMGQLHMRSHAHLNMPTLNGSFLAAYHKPNPPPGVAPATYVDANMAG